MGTSCTSQHNDKQDSFNSSSRTALKSEWFGLWQRADYITGPNIYTVVLQTSKPSLVFLVGMGTGLPSQGDRHREWAAFR